ncbi:hypothetical protein JHK86_051122 [Glycine max]|nr:hypothetical protein JHK86_051122 [Glycine max]
MGNCGTREESAVVSNAQVVQQLHHATSLGASARSQNAGSEKKHGHGHGHRHNLSECASDLSESCSTPHGNNSNNTLLYTHVIAFTLYELETITKSFRGDYILEATVPLSWATRMMIALGAAKGLAFLHNAERPDYTAKLSDFGLAKAGPQGDETHVSTRVMGTYGYAAPEYVMTGHLTARSDVYSFGVVLLELLTGRKSVDKTRPGKEQSLVDWARPKLNDKRKLLQIIDPRLENQYSVRAAQKACSLAYYCLSQNPKARPLMSDVVETLEPLQSSSVGPGEVSLSGSNSGSAGPFAMNKISDYRMRHKFSNNVGPGATCRSPNPSCSPGGPATLRVR